MAVEGNMEHVDFFGLRGMGVGPVSKLPVTKNAAKLRILLPKIEQALAEGVTHSTILSQLNSAGFALTEPYYKNILRRLRKEVRSGVAAAPVQRLPPREVFPETPPLPSKAVATREAPASAVKPADATNKFVWDVKSTLPW